MAQADKTDTGVTTVRNRLKEVLARPCALPVLGALAHEYAELDPGDIRRKTTYIHPLEQAFFDGVRLNQEQRSACAASPHELDRIGLALWEEAKLVRLSRGRFARLEREIDILVREEFESSRAPVHYLIRSFRPIVADAPASETAKLRDRLHAFRRVLLTRGISERDRLVEVLDEVVRAIPEAVVDEPEADASPEGREQDTDENDGLAETAADVSAVAAEEESEPPAEQPDDEAKGMSWAVIALLAGLGGAAIALALFLATPHELSARWAVHAGVLGFGLVTITVLLFNPRRILYRYASLAMASATVSAGLPIASLKLSGYGIHFEALADKLGSTPAQLGFIALAGYALHLANQAEKKPATTTAIKLSDAGTGPLIILAIVAIVALVVVAAMVFALFAFLPGSTTSNDHEAPGAATTPTHRAAPGTTDQLPSTPVPVPQQPIPAQPPLPPAAPTPRPSSKPACSDTVVYVKAQGSWRYTCRCTGKTTSLTGTPDADEEALKARGRAKFGACVKASKKETANP